MIIELSEDLGLPIRSPMRFCAVVVNDTNPERAGFGHTEDAALAYLAKQYGTTHDALVASADIERMAVR